MSKSNESLKGQQEGEQETHKESFWHWSSFTIYLKYITLLFCTLIALTAALARFHTYTLFLGSLSAAVEATLGVPQFLLNYKRKNTFGLSVVLIMLWALGDIFKFYYYFSEHSPIALLACASFQIFTDFSILF
jgi:ABC-type amino acid transport system permease subunit